MSLPQEYIEALQSQQATFDTQLAVKDAEIAVLNAQISAALAALNAEKDARASEAAAASAALQERADMLTDHQAQADAAYAGGIKIRDGLTALLAAFSVPVLSREQQRKAAEAAKLAAEKLAIEAKLQELQP